MKKILLAIIIAVAVGIGITLATSLSMQPQLEREMPIVISVDKDVVSYGDTVNWSAKGFPPNAGYKTLLGWVREEVFVVFITGEGAADANGEASGSFVVGENISGPFTFKLELLSDAEEFGVVSIDLKDEAGEMAPQAIVVSVDKDVVSYGDTVNWSAKDLPPNEGYKTSLEWSGEEVYIILIMGEGTTDANGEARGSFVVEENVSGPLLFKLELLSDAEEFGVVSIDIKDEAGEMAPQAIVVSVDKDVVSYGDTVNWSAKDLPPNEGYKTSLWYPDTIFTILILGEDVADANGEARGSFVVGEDISGPFHFRIELLSDPDQFGVVSIDLVPGTVEEAEAGEMAPQAIVVSVDKDVVSYGDTVNWSAKDLPPNEGYKTSLRWLIASEQKDGVGVGRFAIVQIGDGAADANGEARGSFVVGENISGPFTFELKLLSDADGFGEVSIDLIPRGTILNPLPYTLDIRTETVIDGLGECGTSFVFVPDGRIFCTELKSGKVRVIENFQLLPEPLIQLEVYHTSDFPPDERGLTGITIDPEFEKNHYVYLHWTYWDSEDNEQYNRVARFTESNNKLNDMKILLGKIPAAAHHNGGPLEFGYDGKLYVTGGDAQGLFSPAGEQAQNMNTSAGKIFRINSDGTIPEDNPFPGLPYYTLGHRNVFGIGFHPETGIAYVTENGPECCDELNKLTPSKNYGWPYFAGRERWYMNVAEDFLIGKEYHGPLMQFFSIIAPTELTFYSGDRYIGENNNMFFLSFMHTQLYRVILKPPNYDEVESASVYSISLESDKEGIFDSLFDIEQGPDGYLYVSSFRSIMRLDFIYSDLPTTILLESKSAVKTGETVGLKAAISDYFGNPVAGLPIEFFDSDKLIGSAISNQDGIAEIEYSLEGMGQHIITAKYAGGEKYLESSSAERILPIQE